jgi:hypothetical protein
MDGPGDYHVQPDKPRLERPVSHALTHMWNLKLNNNNKIT